MRWFIVVGLLCLPSAGCPDDTTTPVGDIGTADTNVDAQDGGGDTPAPDAEDDTPVPDAEGDTGDAEPPDGTTDDGAVTDTLTDEGAEDGGGDAGDGTSQDGEDGSDAADGADGETTSGCEVLQFTGALSNLQAGVWVMDAANVGGPEQDFLVLEFYSDATGTFDLASGVNSSYATCEQCVRLLQDVDPGTGEAAASFFQVSGSITIAAATPPASQTAGLTGSVSAELVEVTIDENFVSTPVPGGGCFTVEPMALGCEPDCTGVTCGDDGCGGVCDSCGDGQVCDVETEACVEDPCGDFTFEGCCNGDVVVYCEGGAVQSIDCGGNPSCGWNADFGGYDCGTDGTSDPGGSFPIACPACTPDCDGKMCGPDGCGGQCGDCGDGQVCDPWDSACKPDVQPAGGCGDLTFEGCCDGQILTWCDGGAVQTADCTGGPSCGWEPGGGYYDCTGNGADPSGANPIDCPPQPSCLGKQCGDDGAGGSCGTCPGTSTCNADGLCECAGDGDCAGMECATSAVCADGICQFAWNTGDCDDGDACTTGDTCTAGTCAGTPACDDGVDCTADSCEPSDGSCTNTPDDAACDDGNDCTADSCDAAGGCQHTALDGQGCDDGDACTTGDVCAGETCGGAAVDCDDGVDCTTDSCDAGTGDCVNAPDDAACADDDACTDDVCDAAAGCTNDAAVCDDGDPCTLDSCDPATGCAAAPLAEDDPCDDGDPATMGDVCDAAGACAGTPYTCTPGVCEVSSTPNGVDCDVVYEDDGTPCDDGDAGTSGDACDGAGTCAGTPASSQFGPGASASGAAGSHALNFYLAQQITFGADVTVTGFGIALASDGATAVMGLYSGSGSPQTLVVATADESLVTGNNSVAATAPTPVAAGTYWIVVNYTSTTSGIAVNVVEQVGTSVTAWYASDGGSTTLPATLSGWTTYSDEQFAWWVEGY